MKILFLTLIFNLYILSANEDYKQTNLNTTYNNPTTINSEDIDNDLVLNQHDICPSTPPGVCVTDKGCTQILKYTLHFDTGLDTINKDSRDILSQIVNIAQECYGYKIIIEGHTDSTSGEKYNQYLSKKRAIQLKKAFLLYGIKAKRITLKWFGETKPVSSNNTVDGRKQNRRVDIYFK